jgi:hypothetical protein
MAWFAPTPDRLVSASGDYATFNSNQTPNGLVRRPQKSKSTSRYPHPRVGYVKILERLDNIRGQTWAAVTRMPCRIVPLPPHTKRTLLQRRGSMRTGWRPVSFGAARVVTRLVVREDIVWLEPWTKLGMRLVVPRSSRSARLPKNLKIDIVSFRVAPFSTERIAVSTRQRYGDVDPVVIAAPHPEPLQISRPSVIAHPERATSWVWIPY